MLLLPIMISEVLYKKDDQRPRLGLILNRNLPSLQNFELLPDSQIVIGIFHMLSFRFNSFK